MSPPLLKFLFKDIPNHSTKLEFVHAANYDICHVFKTKSPSFLKE
ncbi:MAG: hypothetical protein V4642_10070 [Bacteroidota bacterium]